MTLQDIFAALWHRLWIILICATLAAAAAYVWVSRQPIVYEATTTVMVGRGVDTSNPSANDFYASQQLARTYMLLAERQPIQMGVIEALGLEMTPARLGQMVDLSLIPNTPLLEITVKGGDPALIAAIANEMANQLIVQSPEGDLNKQAERRRFTEAQMAELQLQINIYQDEAQKLEAALDSARNEDELKTMEARIDLLRERIGELQKTYTGFSDSLNATPLNKITILEPATAPTRPVNQPMVAYTLLAAITAAMFAAAAILALAYLDDRFHSPERVEEVLGLSTLGMAMKTAEADKLVTIAQPRAPLSEAFRVLRANLQFAAMGKKFRVLLVGSPSPLEGKSTTSANLAVVLAQSGQRVILVDADLRRPRQHKLFNLPNQTGLTTAIVQPDVDLRQLIKPTVVERLSLLSSGPIPPNPSDLLGSERMKEVIAELQEVADIIILDSPPVLAAADAAMLASHVDAMVLVINAQKTKQRTALRAVEQLRQANANLVGAMLNQITEQSEGYYYYYYYTSSPSDSDGGDGGGAATRPTRSPKRRPGKLWRTITSWVRSS